MYTDDIKYVIVLCFGLEMPILLGNIIQHAEATGLMTAVAAGFCSIKAKDGTLTVECWGDSISLGRHSRGEQDAAIIKRELERTQVKSVGSGH